MKRFSFSAIFFGLVGCSLSINAVTFNYTNTETGPNNIPLGYEVPIPVDSLTPIAGFRTYDSLVLRHLQISDSSDLFTQIQIGQTFNGRPIFAYQLGDADALTIDGDAEGAALINGGIHAREWQTPEAVTGYMEYLFDNRTDQHLAQFILENMNFVVIPVLNVDGFLQTQRFPSLTTDTQATPRDGRMRRKNMRNVDEDLDSLSDNLNGIDLNRNNAPYWATSNSSSNETSSLVYHGASPASEPETQALQQGAAVAGEDRLRFYIDTHSFTQKYFASYTNNTRRNAVNDRIALIMRAANNFKYEYDPSPANVGIGLTDEYFANTYQAISYTLETEPAQSNAEYGGTGVSHGGFVLPNAEVPRMRTETTNATMAGLYAMTYPPSVTRVEIVRSRDQATVFVGQFVKQGEGKVLNVSNASPLQGEEQYQLFVRFNKPMRQLENGDVVGFSNLSNPVGISLALIGTNNSQEVVYDMDTSQGEWLVDNGFNRYKTDTFSQPFSLPGDFDWSAHTLLALSTATNDFTGQNLDADTSTVADWRNGSWSDYEDSNGNNNNDQGGTNKAFRLIDDGSDLFAPSAPAPAPTPTPTPSPTPSSSSGGGALSIGMLMLLIVIARRRLFTFGHKKGR